VRKLLKAIKNLNLTNNFLIIGSDGWADRQDVVVEYEPQAVGSISIRIHSPYLKSFDDYYLKLDPFNNTRNPWFKEFWEDKFNCKMPVSKISTEAMAADTKIENITDTGPESLLKVSFCNGM
jgi:metabotropic glutamate receptor 1